MKTNANRIHYHVRNLLGRGLRQSFRDFGEVTGFPWHHEPFRAYSLPNANHSIINNNQLLAETITIRAGKKLF